MCDYPTIYSDLHYSISKNKVVISPIISTCKVLLSCHAILCQTLFSNITKEKIANLYVLDEHLKQEKGKEKEISSKVWITCQKQYLIFVNYTAQLKYRKQSTLMDKIVVPLILCRNQSNDLNFYHHY